MFFADEGVHESDLERKTAVAGNYALFFLTLRCSHEKREQKQRLSFRLDAEI